MNEKLSILNSILGTGFKSSEEHLFACPYCGHHKKKFSVNIEKNMYKCWICDARGKSLLRVIRRFGNFSQLEKWKELSGHRQDLGDFESLFMQQSPVEQREAILEMPQGFKSLTTASTNKFHLRAISYLSERGIGIGEILKWKMGYTAEGPFRNRIIIPSFNASGELNYFIARTFANDYRRYMNPPVSRNIVFNELYIDFEEEVVIVEGVFDAIKASNAVPILGSTIRETSKLFRKIINNDAAVLLALDPDARKKSESIKRLFLKYGIEVREFIYPDERDIGDMSREEVSVLSQKAKFVKSYDNLLNAISAI
jgi:DNA primase